MAFSFNPPDSLLTDSEVENLANEVDLSAAASIIAGLLEQIASNEELNHMVVDGALARLDFWSQCGRSWLDQHNARRPSASGRNGR